VAGRVQRRGAGGRPLIAGPATTTATLALTASPLHTPATLSSLDLAAPIVTAAGLALIGAAFDNHLRAFAVEPEVELWEGERP
jgi:glucose dehydrogenase